MASKPKHYSFFFLCLVIFGALATTLWAKETQWHHVVKVRDGDTLVLDNHENVRLVAIQAPETGRKKRKNELHALNAMRVLEELALGQDIRLDHTGRKRDRYDRLLAHLYRRDGVWLQEEMVRRGAAFVYSFADNRAHLRHLQRIEQEARNAKRGLWQHKRYQPVQHENAAYFLGKFGFVEGTVHKVSKIRSRWYVNFTKNWRKDFTLFIASHHADDVARELGLDSLRDLAGRTLRSRGHVFYKNGPMIRITHPEQIELLTSDNT